MVTSLRGRPLLAVRRVGQKMADLARARRVRDVDKAQPLGKPGERDDGAAEPFRRLMTAAHRRLRRRRRGPARAPGRSRSAAAAAPR